MSLVYSPLQFLTLALAQIGHHAKLPETDSDHSLTTA
jgi:hypothetical protein